MSSTRTDVVASTPKRRYRLRLVLLICVLLATLPASPVAQAQSTGAAAAQQTARLLVGTLRGKLTGSAAGRPAPVHSFGSGQRSYYLVPIEKRGRTVGLVGVSADGRSWQWYTDNYRGRPFPSVGANQAGQIIGTRVSDLVMMLGPDRELYWTSISDRGKFVSVQDAGRVRTLQEVSQEPDDASLAGLPHLMTDAADSAVTAPEAALPRPLAAGSVLPTRQNRSIPFYYQVNSYYCGPAVVQMLFDRYNPPVASQYDIGAVMNAKDWGTWEGAENEDLLRAARFSSLSRAIQNNNLQGYRERSIGYAAASNLWSREGADDPDYPDRYSDLKRLIADGYPLVLVTWYDASHEAGHFRLLKGYDDSTGAFIVHDPYYHAPYFGPNVHFRQSFLVDDLWARERRWAALIQPWRVALSTPATVTAGAPFTVTARIAYLGPHPFEGKAPVTESRATIQVPSGFRVNTATRSLPYITRSGKGQTVSWSVTPPATYKGTARIRMVSQGKFTGTSQSYPTYTDWIGGTGQRTVSVSR